MDAITERIAVPGAVGELRHLHAFLSDFWQRHGLPPRDAMRVELGLEEVFIKVVAGEQAVPEAALEEETR